MEFLKKTTVTVDPISIFHNYYWKPILQNIYKWI